jgi:ribonuclease BN (tRNA processing enzyme)
MKVTILGSGSFVTDHQRFGPCFLVQENDKNYLVDCGSGTQIRLSELGLKIKNFEAIFLTHFHPDHTSDFFSLLVQYSIFLRNNSGAECGLKVFGPKGIEEFISSSFRLFDLPQFLGATHPTGAELSPEQQFDGFTVTPFRVEHLGVEARAYRFVLGGKVIVFSGDTTLCPGIQEAIVGADLVFIDSSLNKDEEPIPHLNTTQIGEICKTGGVKKVILCHIIGYNEKRDLVSEVKETFDGEVVLAKDLLEINL